MPREKLKVVTPSAEPAEPGRYVLDEQVGFLMRVAMQRHTSIFMSRMIEGADADPVRRARQAATRSGPARRTISAG